MKYFVKYVVSNRIYVNGSPVPFEILADDVGVIALDDNSSDPNTQAILKALTAAAANRILGVGEITREEYEELKKNLPLVKSDAYLTPYPRLDNLFDPQQRAPRLPEPPRTARSSEPAVFRVAQEPPSDRADIATEEATDESLVEVEKFVPATRRVRVSKRQEES